MAENLLTHSLHTKKKYAEELGSLYASKHQDIFSKMIGNTDLDKQIYNLQEKEKSYYSQAGANNYSEFKEKISECLTKEVAFGLSQLGGGQLRNNLYRLKDQHKKEETTVDKEIEVVVDVYRLVGAVKGINSMLDELEKVGATTRLKGGKAKMRFGLNTESFKKLFNVVKEFEDKKGNKKKGRRYSEESGRLSTALANKINEFEDEGWLLLNGVQPEKGRHVLSEKLKTSEKFLGYPWNFNTSDVERAIAEGEDGAFRKVLIDSLDDIKEWLLDTAGTTSELREAIKEEWEKVVGQEYSNLTNASFFLKGGYIELVVGALGEFQTAVFQNLLSRHFPGMRHKFSAAISGNVFQGSEQSKADVLFGELGIQVKNYASPARPIEGNIHPYELTKYYSDETLYDSGFFGVLANRYWIEFKMPDEVALEKDLEGALAAILNFNALDVGLSDKISFYMIAGNYLVPASVILANFKDIRDSQQIKIESRYSPQREEDIPDNLYWRPNEEGIYSRTDLNDSVYENLLKKSITLRADFKYNRIEHIEDYKII